MVNKLFIFYLFKTQIQIRKTQIKTQIRKIRKTQIKTKNNKYKKEFIIVKIVDVNYKTQLY